MKKIFLICLSLLTYNAFSQNLTFTEVVKVDSISQADLYFKAKEWMAYAFKSAQNVIQYDEKDKGKIIGKGNYTFYGQPFTSGTKSTGPVDFTVTIEAKDGRYRYTFTDFIHSGQIISEAKPKSLSLTADRYVWKDAKNQVPALIADLKRYMAGNSVNNKSTDF